MAEGDRTLPSTGRGLARRRALLDAAARLFVEKGYGKTTLDDIVAVAGGSKATLYAQFGDKEGLFRAIMAENQARIQAGLDRVVACQSLTPEEALTQVALQFLGVLLQEETLSVIRVLIAEGGRVPQVVDEFMRTGPEVTNKRLSDYLAGLSDRGLLSVPDPATAARAFLGMVTGRLLFDRLVMPERTLDLGREEHYVRQAVRLFLDGVSPAGARATRAA